MQITKLKSIENLGIFKKFPKNSDEKIFKRYNLIYGWNGSGKTTLSKLFQFIEWGGDYNNIPEICEPEFYKNLNAEITTSDPSDITLKIIDGQTNQTDIINSLNVRVFNSVFIENNIDWNGRTKEIVIGQASKNAKEDIEKINTTINTYYDKSLHESGSPIYIKTLKDKYDTCIQKISNFSDEAYLTDTAAKIYNKAVQGTMYNNYSQKSVYNKADLKRFLSINHTKEQIQSKTDIKTDDEINNLSYEIKHATEKPVFTYNFDPKTFHELFFFDVETIKKEISEDIVSAQTIKELTENPELQKWVKEGFFHIHDKNDTKCKFCGGSLEGVLERLGRHFDTKYIEHEQKLRERINELNNIKIHVNNLYDEIPKSDDLLQAYKEKYEKFQTDTLLPLKNDFFLNLDILIESLQLKLDGRKSDAEEKLKEYTWKNRDFPTVLQTLHNLIDDNNKDVNNFQNAIKTKQEKIEAYYALKIFDEYTEKQAKKEFFERKMNSILFIQEHRYLPKINSLLKQKAEKEALLTNTLIAAEDINKLLLSFWGDKIKLHPHKNSYQILRKKHNGDYVPAKNMSDGEKTVMAFCYFLISLKSKKSDGTNNKIEDTIIVIDDPISSLSNNYIYQIYSYINSDFDTAKQVFIFSHNFYFINLVKRWLLKKKDYTFLMLKDNHDNGDFTPLLSAVDKLLANFHSEYHFLYCKLLEAQNNFDIENSYGIPNMLRQFIESFLAFKVPNGSGELETKLITLRNNCRSKITNEQIKSISRYIDFNSHREKIESISDFTDILNSSVTILNDTFELLNAADPHHFAELKNCLQSYINTNKKT